ncbi:putative metal-binding motif-containing protein [Candidatus Woesearchaeota archaeon]|nr:putative metal-binding motif-containing protein [Candidatus Woesearchaeota archaeon]
MKFKKSILILIVIILSSILLAHLASSEDPEYPSCDCGVYRLPLKYNFFTDNYEEPFSETGTNGTGTKSCNITCREITGVLKEECTKDGKYYAYINCPIPPYMLRYAIEECADPESEEECETENTVRNLINYLVEEVNLDANPADCAQVIAGSPSEPVSVYVEGADQGNNCCGNEGKEDIGYMADGSRQVCIDDSSIDNPEEFPGKYQWLHAGQHWFKIVTVNRSVKKNPVIYDVISNAEKWFVCQPGVPIVGPTYTVEIIPPERPLTGAPPGLGQGTIGNTVGQGIGAPPILAPTPTMYGSETNLMDISDFGSDFEILYELTTPTTENDQDGDGYVDLSMGGTDCNDLNPTIYPGAHDPCGDAIDQDCDSQTHIKPDGASCQPVQLTLGVPSLAERFMCFNEDEKGTFAECCGYDANNCYNEVPKGRRQGAVLTTIEEFQEGCSRTANCVLEFGLIPKWGEPFYTFDIDIDRTDSQLHNWTDYESLEFFIYLSDDFVQDIIILGQQTGETGDSLEDYELLFFQPITKYVVNTVSLRKWMHVVIPLDDPNWVDPPDYVSHIVFYADTEKVRTAGGLTQTTIADSLITTWDNVIGLDRFFLKPKTTPHYCTGTNKPMWISDLDNATRDLDNISFGKSACQSTPTFGWTGAQCCGDDTTAQTHEYFADSLAGCWKGNFVPPDTTIMNVEYELTYQVPTYSKTEITSPSIYETQDDFEYYISVLRFNEPEDNFRYYDIETINYSKIPKDIGEIRVNLPEPEWVEPQTAISKYAKGQSFCPVNQAVVAMTSHHDGYMLKAFCADIEQGVVVYPNKAPATQPIDIAFPLTIMATGIDKITGGLTTEQIGVIGSLIGGGTLYGAGWAKCGINQVVCGIGSSKHGKYWMSHAYCCPTTGMNIDSFHDVIEYSISADRKLVCPDSHVVCGVRWPGSKSGSGSRWVLAGLNGFMCCKMNPIAAYLLEDNNENITTYFEPTAYDQPFLSNTNTSHIMAVSDIRQVTGGKQAFNATLDGTRTETTRFTQTCSKNECEYPYVGEIPPTCGQLICGQETIGEFVKNPHPELYDISVDYNKSLIKVSRIRQEIIFWNETFYGCAASDYTMNVDPDLYIDNSAQMCDVIGSHFCSPGQGWNNRLEGAPNASSRDTVKATPIEYPIQSSSCCPESYCWNDTACVPSEANATSLINPLIIGDKIWRCLDGNWSLAIKRYTWDFSQSGFCPTHTQCLVDPAGNALLNDQPESYDPTSTDVPQCIESGQFIVDHYCFNGTWTSRTKLIALQFLDIVNETGDIDNYTLFCDNYKNALANYDYLSIEDVLRGKLYARPPISIYTCSDNTNYVMPCVNNFCVIKYIDRSSGEQKVLLGTSLNRPIDDPEFSFLRALDQTSTYCSNLQGTGFGFQKCSNDANIWYSDEINSVIFSKTGTSVGALSIIDSFARFLFNPINSIINYVVDVIAPRAEPSGALIDYNFTQNVKDFNQIYINRLLDISIKAIIEEPQLDKKFVTIKYFEVPEDICLAVDVYDRANPPDGQISCTKEDSVYYVISDQEVAFDVWTDFTSKLRPVYP